MVDLDEPGRTPVEELTRALARLHGVLPYTVQAINAARRAREWTGREPRGEEYPGARRPPEPLAPQHEAWLEAIGLLRGACPLWRVAFRRACEALPGVSAGMDEHDLPAPQRFTGRVGALLSRLRAVLPAWPTWVGTHEGDQFARRAEMLADPSWAMGVMAEIEGYLHTLRGVLASQPEEEVGMRPEPIERVIELVRGSPAMFAPALQQLEKEYGVRHMRRWCRQTAQFELQTSPLPKEEKRGWGRYEPGKLKVRWGKQPHPGRQIIPHFLMRARAHRNTSEVVPLRLAFLQHGKQPWDPFGDVKVDREDYARKLAVLAVLAFDPDVEEYLADHGAWARIPWWGEGSGWMVGGRSVLRNCDHRDPGRWIDHCKKVLQVLPLSQHSDPDAQGDSNSATPMSVLEPTPDDLPESERRALQAETLARELMRDKDQAPTLRVLFDRIVEEGIEGYDETERKTWERQRRRARQRLGMPSTRVRKDAPGSTIDRRTDRRTTAPTGLSA